MSNLDLSISSSGSGFLDVADAPAPESRLSSSGTCALISSTVNPDALTMVSDRPWPLEIHNGSSIYTTAGATNL